MLNREPYASNQAKIQYQQTTKHLNRTTISRVSRTVAGEGKNQAKEQTWNLNTTQAATTESNSMVTSYLRIWGKGGNILQT